MRNPEFLGDRELSEIEDLVNEYPFFQSARMLYVKNLRNQGYSDYNKVLRKNAVFITNRSKLFFLLNNRTILQNDADAAQQAVEEEVFDFRALEAMAGFKPQHSKTDKAKEEIEKLIAGEKPYFNNISDTVDIDSFRATFGRASNDKKARHDALLDKFIDHGKHAPKSEQTDESQENVPDLSLKSSTESSDLISETLAKIYVKQGSYESALLMYEKMCLKYPEKKTYFADRIREIKEIINNK